MPERTLQMTQRDLDRLRTLHLAIGKQITQKKAGQILDLCREHVNRLCQKIRKHGDQIIIHGLRGQPSNNKLPQELTDKAIGKIKKKYADFGPTLAMEKLRDLEKIELSKETVRKEMIQADLWKPKKRKTPHRSWRERKDCFGEMEQMDGSIHDWLEGRGPICVLLAAIDDASNRIFLKFTESEDTKGLMSFCRAYVEKFGRPISFYVDKDSIYIANRQANLEEDLKGSGPLTQFKRAAEIDLGIKIINANSPQAKGRVERLFGTLQDRLIKEMRLAGVNTIEEANNFLNSIYIDAHNKKFSVLPKNNADVHRLLRKTKSELDSIFSIQEARVLRSDYTIRWRNRLFQIKKHQPFYILPKSNIIVEEHLDGKIKIRLKVKYLNFKEIAPEEIRPKQAVNQLPALKPLVIKATPPPASHPWRRTFKVWRAASIAKNQALAPA